MAIGAGGHIEIALVMLVGGSQTMNVYDYEVTAFPGNPSAVAVAQGWWDAVKVAYRAIAIANFGTPFRSVKIRDIDNITGEAGEYAIPTAEQTGTRPAPTQAQILPYFTAAGVRLTVATRVTRPGQKRFPFLVEDDNDTGALGAAYTALAGTLAAKVIAPGPLGAPALLTDMHLMVVNKQANGQFNHGQSVAGYVVSQQITSQNTRKPGRGS